MKKQLVLLSLICRPFGVENISDDLYSKEPQYNPPWAMRCSQVM